GEQTSIGALGSRQRSAEARPLQSEDLLRGAEPLQPVRTEVDQPEAVAEHGSDERGRDRRQEQLPTVGLASKSSGQVHGRAEVVGSPLLRLAGVQPETNL